MAGKLDDMIAADEQVIYRARAGWRVFLWSYLAYTVFLILASLTWYWLRGVDVGGDTYPLYPFAVVLFLIYMIPLMVGITSLLRNKAALITNRRFLYKTGVLKPKVLKILFADIERIAFMPIMADDGRGEIQVRAGKVTRFYFGRNTERLCAAIKAQLGLPYPAKAPRKVILWAYFIWIFGILSVGIFALVTMRIFGSSFFEWLDPQWTSILFPFELLLGFGLYYALLWMIMLVSSALALCLVRVFLSTNEAKQLVCLGFHPYFFWRPAKLLSRLYGQPIRCEDDE